MHRRRQARWIGGHPLICRRVDEDGDRKALADALREEVAIMAARHEETRAGRNGSFVGLSGLSLMGVADLLVDFLCAREETITSTKRPGLALKFGAQELIDAYAECVIAAGGADSPFGFRHWYWHETTAGLTVRHLAEIAKLSTDYRARMSCAPQVLCSPENGISCLVPDRSSMCAVEWRAPDCNRHMQSMAATNCVRSLFPAGDRSHVHRPLAPRQPTTGQARSRACSGRTRSDGTAGRESCGQAPRQVDLDTAVTDLCFHADWSREAMVIGAGEQPRRQVMAHPPAVVGVDGRRQGTPYWL